MIQAVTGGSFLTERVVRRINSRCRLCRIDAVESQKFNTTDDNKDLSCYFAVPGFFSFYGQQNMNVQNGRQRQYIIQFQSPCSSGEYLRSFTFRLCSMPDVLLYDFNILPKPVEL